MSNKLNWKLLSIFIPPIILNRNLESVSFIINNILIRSKPNATHQTIRRRCISSYLYVWVTDGLPLGSGRHQQVSSENVTSLLIEPNTKKLHLSIIPTATKQSKKRLRNHDRLTTINSFTTRNILFKYVKNDWFIYLVSKDASWFQFILVYKLI